MTQFYRVHLIRILNRIGLPGMRNVVRGYVRTLPCSRKGYELNGSPCVVIRRIIRRIISGARRSYWAMAMLLDAIIVCRRTVKGEIQFGVNDRRANKRVIPTSNDVDRNRGIGFWRALF